MKALQTELRQSWPKSPRRGAARAPRDRPTSRRPPPPALMNHRLVCKTGDHGINSGKREQATPAAARPDLWEASLDGLCASTGQGQHAAGDGRPTLSAVGSNRRSQALGGAAERRVPSWQQLRVEAPCPAHVRKKLQPPPPCCGRRPHTRFEGDKVPASPTEFATRAFVAARAGTVRRVPARPCPRACFPHSPPAPPSRVRPVGWRSVPGRMPSTSLCRKAPGRGMTWLRSTPGGGRSTAKTPGWPSGSRRLQGFTWEPHLAAHFDPCHPRGGRWLPSTPFPVVPVLQCRQGPPSCLMARIRPARP